MDKLSLLEPLLEKKLDQPNISFQKMQASVSTTQLFHKNESEPELLSLKQAVLNISLEFEKKLPHAINIPFLVDEMMPFSDEIHYLVSTTKGNILYFNAVTQHLDEKKISAGPFSIAVLENERIAYFSRENEIFCISIPSLEFKSFRKFEGKHLVCLKNSWDKKSLIALFDDEITSISFSDPGESKTLVSGKFTKIDISNKGYFALISSEDRLVLLSPESEKIAEVAIEPKSIKLKF